MAIRVSPTEAAPTHDVSLSDGVTTVGLRLVNGQGQPDPRAMRQASTPRTSLQIQQGDPDYSGFNLPYTPITQKDWSGGRGLAEFRRDTTRYYDSYNLDTRFGDIILAPLASEATGLNTAVTPYSNDATRVLTGSSTIRYASSYTPSANMTLRRIIIPITSASETRLTVSVINDLGGVPGGALDTLGTGYVYISEITELTYVDVLINATLTASDLVWIVVSSSDSDITVYTDTSTTDDLLKETFAVWGTEAADTAIAYQFSASVSGKTILFEFRGSEMAIQHPDEDGAPRLYINGFHGMAASNSANKSRLYTNRSLAGEFTPQAVVKIYKGPGSAEETNYRTAGSNSMTGSNDYIEVYPAWRIEHTTSTEYIVSAYNKWTEITGHGLTKPVTAVLVVGDYVYFAQGDTTAIRRARWNETGQMTDSAQWTWDAEGDIDATYKGATYLALIPTTAGAMKVWAAQANTSKVYSADMVTTWTDLTFTQANNSKAVGNPASKITGMVAYGDGGSSRIPYIFKEDGFGSIANNIYAEIPSAELAAVRSEHNGKAAVVHGVYLFFAVLDGYERYYDQHLDDIGPQRGEGLPTGRRGHIAHAISYPGMVLVALDAGLEGYSSILAYNELGWHELYRSAYGERIRHMHIQVIDGETPDRLWVSQGESVYWLPITLNPRKQDGYTYQASGYLVTSWYTTGFGSIYKFWKSLNIFAENIDTGNNNPNITVAYQLDSDTDSDAWTDLPGTFDTTPDEEVLITSDYSAVGKRIRFKVTLTTPTDTETPRLIAMTINVVTRVPPAKTFAVTFQADDFAVTDAEAELEALSMDELLLQLETWADSDQPTGRAPLTMRSILPQFDNIRVFIDAPNVTPREVQIDTDTRVVKAIGNISVYKA